MGVTSAVQYWWEESQMRVLVLGSLVVQYLLFIFTFLRSRAIPGWIRFLTWLTYLGGDAVAIYALATLFNRHKDPDRRGKNKLEVMWAPILLLHLGGQDGITAYNIEDNELWSRHLFTAVSQVAVSIYVFCKSWPPGSDKRLLQVSILLFVSGVIKCFRKPWAVKRASIASLVSSPAAKRTAKKGKAGEKDPHSLEKYVKQAKAFVQEQTNDGNEAQSESASVDNSDRPPPQQGKRDKDEMAPLEEYMKLARDGAQGERPPVEDTKWTQMQKQRARQRIVCREVRKLFVDLSSPYASRRLSIFKYFWVLINQEKAETTTRRKSTKGEDKVETAYGYVRRGLSSAFQHLYTRLKTAATPVASDFYTPATAIGFICRVLTWMSHVVLPLAATALCYTQFERSHGEEAYNHTDVKITGVLLGLTALLEALSIYPLLCHSIITSGEWPEMVAQYSLVGYLARNKNHGRLMWVASKLGCRDLVDRQWCMKPCSSSSSRGITELVLQYLRAGWEKKIQDAASYHSFIDNRGHWALEANEDLRWSIKKPFDESVLLWHIATDFCSFSTPVSEHTRVCDFAKVPSTWQSLLEFLHLKKTSGNKKCGQRLAECKAVQCRQMSNYMVYLLFVNPEMLLPGTRRNLFTTAYHELKDILVGDNEPNPQSCCQKVVQTWLMETLIDTVHDNSMQGQPMVGCNGNFIHDAWDLAQGLLKLRDDSGEEKMWEVIQRVWVEMLCFSASRCRGYLHAKALGSGGEFLSYIWLLLFYMGMETFSERLQREKEELPSREANNNAAPPASGDLHKGSGTASSSVSRIRSRAAPSASYLHTGASTSNSDEIQMANMV